MLVITILGKLVVASLLPKNVRDPVGIMTRTLVLQKLHFMQIM